MNVTLVPSQIDPIGLSAIVTLAAPPAFTDIVMLLDVAGDPETQVSLDVITHVMISPLARAVDV